MSYFENNKGLMSKVYVYNYYDDTWTLNVILYDGDYVDKKFVAFQIYIDNVQKDMSLNQPNGTFSAISPLKMTASFGEAGQTNYQQGILNES